MEKAIFPGHLAVTIARAMGAGGAEVGHRLAAKLGCSYLDRTLLTEAAHKLNRDEADLESRDEHRLPLWERKTFVFGLGLPNLYDTPPSGLDVDDKLLFSIQQEIIRSAVASSPTVIVGRAAHWVLQGHPLLLSVYLHAPIQERTPRLQRAFSLASEADARDLADKTDRRRAEFSKWVTGRDWRDPSQYHLCIDTGRLGLDATFDVIVGAAAHLQASPSREKTSSS